MTRKISLNFIFSLWSAKVLDCRASIGGRTSFVALERIPNIPIVPYCNKYYLQYIVLACCCHRLLVHISLNHNLLMLLLFPLLTLLQAS